MKAIGSSIRVSSQTRMRVGKLARKMRVTSHQEVIERALDKLERELFWRGFDQEASGYLRAYPEEWADRNRYGGTSGDGLPRRG